MKKRVLITVGGTGGHIYPAMALARQLQNSHAEVLFVGGGLTTNRYFESSSFQYQQVDCGNFHRNPFTSLKGMRKIIRGLFQSKNIIRKFNPDVVVGFGSYYTLPTLLAAKLHKIPIILHEANRIPGKVNRLLSKHVDITGVHFPDTKLLLKGKTVEAKIPLREGYALNHISTVDARKYYNLDPNLLTLLVFGGSQGAHAINQLLAEALIALPASLITQLQVLHVTGDSAMTQLLKGKYATHGINAIVKDFESQMNVAWQAADFMVSRAGAGTIVEQLEFEVPGILIPYPHATDNHQEKNADFMVQDVGGAIKCLEHTLANNQLAQKLIALLSNKQQKLEQMRQAMQTYKHSKQPCDFYSVVLKVMQGKVEE